LEKHQAAIAKMSDVRLRQKLEQAGYKADDIKCERKGDLMAAYADLAQRYCN